LGQPAWWLGAGDPCGAAITGGNPTGTSREEHRQVTADHVPVTIRHSWSRFDRQCGRPLFPDRRTAAYGSRRSPESASMSPARQWQRSR